MSQVQLSPGCLCLSVCYILLLVTQFVTCDPVFCPGFQKGRVPSEKGTFSAVSGPSKGHN